jgi:hypothetical protein
MNVSVARIVHASRLGSGKDEPTRSMPVSEDGRSLVGVDRGTWWIVVA